MNFLTAIKHATIGYGIRRKAWREADDCILSMDNFGDLYWLNETRCILLGDDLTKDLIAEDIQSSDWEVV